MLLTLDNRNPRLTLLYSPRTTTEVDFFLTHLNNALSTYKSIACTISFLTGSFRRRRLNISSDVAASMSPQASPPDMLTDEVPAVMGLNSPITEGVKKEFRSELILTKVITGTS